MNKIVVGILPKMMITDNNDPYENGYMFVDMYANKIKDCDAIPLGILPEGINLNHEVLNLCDAFVIPGGNSIKKYVYELILYALKHNKPLLGICMGSQAIAIISAILDRCSENESIEKILKVYDKLKEENDGTLLNRLSSPNMHGDVFVSIDGTDAAKHKIKIEPNSLLSEVYKTSEMDVVSIHKYNYKTIGSKFSISAKAPDGVYEAIEYNDKDYFIVGLHFHPEIDENNLIFEALIDQAKLRK